MKNENIRAAEETVDPGFKKVMRGFDPEEVLAYINELTRNMQNTAKNYEARMADMKQELALANRERDTLRTRCAEYEKGAAPVISETAAAENDDRQALIERLQSQLAEERAAALQAGTGAAENLRRAEEQIEALKTQLLERERQLSENNSQIDALTQQYAQLQPLRGEVEDALIRIEEMKAAKQTLAEEKELLLAEASAAAAHLEKTENENARLKTELSRVQVENTLLSEKNEQYKKEIADLKTESKEKAYAYAEKLSAGEDDLRRERVRLEKKLQMQHYHIEQAGAAIAELQKQLEQVRTSFSE